MQQRQDVFLLVCQSPLSLKILMGLFVLPSIQVHVLTFTVYQLLSVLSPTLKSGDLDPCMNMLIDVRTFHTIIPYTLRRAKDEDCLTVVFLFLLFILDFLPSLFFPFVRSLTTSCLELWLRRRRWRELSPSWWRLDTVKAWTPTSCWPSFAARRASPSSYCR